MVSAVVENSIPKFPKNRRFETSLHSRDFLPKPKRRKVEAVREYPSGYNAAACQTTRRKNEDDLGVKLSSDGLAHTTQTIKTTTKVDALLQYPREYNAAALQRKNEDDLGAKHSDSVAHTSLHNVCRDFLPKPKRRMVDAFRQYPSGYNAAAFQTTWRKNEDDLVAKLSSDSVAQTTEKMKTTKVDALNAAANQTTQRKSEDNLGAQLSDCVAQNTEKMKTKYPSGYNAVAFQTTKRKNEDDLGAQLSNCVAQTTEIDQRKGEGDSMVCAKAGGGSCAYAKPLKSDDQAKNIDALTSLASMSQSQSSITISSPQINAAADAVNFQAHVPVPEHVKPDFPTILEAMNSVSNYTLKQNGHGEGCSKNIEGHDELNGLTIPSTDSNNKAMDALNLFKVIVSKLSKETESKPNAKKVAIYVEAAMLMKKEKRWVNTRKQFGVVPGVNIGDKFQFRAELVIVGLHCCFQSGIDYVKKEGQVLATSIVASGRYGNEMESSDEFIYCGQGGNPMVGNRRLEDQKLERGNLAMYNSMLAKNPIRVIHGFHTNVLKYYTYVGLYVVDKFWTDRGKFGKLVFKFQMKRIGGQPKLTRCYDAKQSKFTWRTLNKPKSLKECKGLCLNDISQGKEKMPIRVVNVIDDEKLPSFEYMTKMIYPEWCKFSLPSGCDCFDECSEKCPCALKKGRFQFDKNGDIVDDKPFVYECGPSCKCSSACGNRVSQHGIRISLEVFKTDSKGWGVRSRNYIPSGSFICEYVGELILDKDAEARIGNDEYLFDIGDRDDDDTMINGGFTIDAAQYGNVARFINHSCSPNLIAQNVLYDHDDKRAPHIMLFAAKNIPPLRELTYDYNYVFDHVCDSNGNVKIKNCYCGSLDCNGRLY